MTSPTDDGLTGSRFNVLPNPVSHPGCCAICGRGSGPVVSWGLRLERFGAVYFCVECTRSAGSSIGMVDGAQLDQATEMYERIIVSVSEERDQLLQRIEDQNIGQDLDTRVNTAVVSALTNPDVLASLKGSLFPEPEPAAPVPAESSIFTADFRL